MKIGLILYVCSLVISAPTVLQGHAALSGQVVDAGGQPLAGASVAVTPLTSNSPALHLTTSKEGTFAVQLLPEGLYSVEVSSPGFLNVRYYPVAVKFPIRSELTVLLPVGEISEGGIQTEATLSGTLLGKGTVSHICVGRIGNNPQTKCTDTNELGQYAISMAPGIYLVHVTQKQKEVLRRRVNLSKPGIYGNLIKLN
jgi:hypothetical protein